MDFLRTRVPQKLYDPPGGRAPDDGIVHHHHPLAPDFAFHGAELDLDLIYPVILPGGDEGPADIFVFDQADAVGNPRFPGIAHGGVQTGIRHADDNVRVHRMGFCKDLPCPDPGIMNADTVDDGIRPGKVDIFKNAHLFGRGAAVAGVGVDAVAVKGQDFSGQNVPLEFRADSVKGAALRCDDIRPVLPFSIAQRAESVGVAHRNELGGGHHDQRKSALQPVHRAADRRLNGGSGDPLPCDHIGDGLRVGGSMENGAGKLQLPAELKRVAQIAVMGKRQLAF